MIKVTLVVETDESGRARYHYVNESDNPSSAELRVLMMIDEAALRSQLLAQVIGSQEKDSEAELD